MAQDNWGDTARIGIFIVGAEVVPEAEWWAMAPPGVSIHAVRISAATPWAQWDAERKGVALADDLRRGAQQFAAMALSSVVLAHSSSSVIGGEGWDAATMQELQRHLHPDTQVTTNGLDCTLALRACGVTRPFVVFPPWFSEAAMQAGCAYLTGSGFTDPVAFRHTPESKWDHLRPDELYGNFMHIDQKADLLRAQIAVRCPDTCDGVLIMGTGLRCVGQIAVLETALDRPVVTANQASLWRALTLANAATPIAGYGRLLSGSPQSSPG